MCTSGSIATSPKSRRSSPASKPNWAARISSTRAPPEIVDEGVGEKAATLARARRRLSKRHLDVAACGAMRKTDRLRSPFRRRLREDRSSPRISARRPHDAATIAADRTGAAELSAKEAPVHRGHAAIRKVCEAAGGGVRVRGDCVADGTPGAAGDVMARLVGRHRRCSQRASDPQPPATPLRDRTLTARFVDAVTRTAAASSTHARPPRAACRGEVRGARRWWLQSPPRLMTAS